MKKETKAELEIISSLMSEGLMLNVEGQKLISEGQGKDFEARKRLDNLIKFDCAEPSWEQLTEALGAGPSFVPIPPSNISPQKKDEDL